MVEKLLANWLSLCMYRYLREEAGASLYTLYQSIKFQVNKGPVDCITCEARYSLSEDRLLRTEKQLEYSVLVSIYRQTEYSVLVSIFRETAGVQCAHKYLQTARV